MCTNLKTCKFIPCRTIGAGRCEKPMITFKEPYAQCRGSLSTIGGSFQSLSYALFFRFWFFTR